MNRLAHRLAHDQAREKFGSLVDRELASDEEGALREHLDGCAECRRCFEKYERALTLVRSLEPERAPADFAHQVMRRVRRRRGGAFGLQGARFFEQVSLPAEAGILIVLAAVIAAALIFAAS